MKELKIVTLDELKAQMREDFDGEDALIQTYGCAAEDAVIGSTYRTLEELRRMGYEESIGAKNTTGALPEGEWFPTRLKVAILMLAANWHKNREVLSQSAQNVVPFAYDFLIKPYRKL